MKNIRRFELSKDLSLLVMIAPVMSCLATALDFTHSQVKGLRAAYEAAVRDNRSIFYYEQLQYTTEYAVTMLELLEARINSQKIAVRP